MVLYSNLMTDLSKKTRPTWPIQYGANGKAFAKASFLIQVTELDHMRHSEMFQINKTEPRPNV